MVRGSERVQAEEGSVNEKSLAFNEKTRLALTTSQVLWQQRG